jgi:formate dehydrogenase maturation protein FdhE
MSIIQSSRGKDQLLADGFRYRRANNSQVTWRCVRNNCAARMTSRDIEYIHLIDHNHAPNSDELLSK